VTCWPPWRYGGTDIGAGELARLLAGPEGAVGEPLQRAVSSGLVRRDPGGTVGFSHDLFREVTYGELAEAERRVAHRRAAEVLAADGYRPSVIADHLWRAAGTGGRSAAVAVTGVPAASRACTASRARCRLSWLALARAADRQRDGHGAHRAGQHDVGRSFRRMWPPTY